MPADATAGPHPGPHAERHAAGDFRYDVRSPEQLAELRAAALPLGVRTTAPARTLHRDLYLDTADDALRARGVVCRLRVAADDRRTLSLTLGTAGGGAERGPAHARATRVDAAVRAADPRAALAEDTAAGRRLRAVVDPALLDVRVELEVERWVRTGLRDWLGRPRLELRYDSVTARRDELARTFQQMRVRRLRGRGDDAEQLARALERDHGLRPLATSSRERAELLLKWAQPDPAAARAWSSKGPHRTPDRANGAGAEFLSPELSLLAFQERVLALAEDPATPLRARLRFLTIVSANVDEFFMVQVAGLRNAAREPLEEQAQDGLTAAERLEAIAERVRALTARQSRCVRACVAELAAHGTRVLAWAALNGEQRATLRAYFREEIHPALTPFAMTMSPGHPLPRFPHLSLSLAIVLHGHDGEPPRFAELELPHGVPRFVPVASAGAGRDVVPLEEVVRANLDALYPHARSARAYLFRVTRGGDLGLDDESGDSLLEAVSAATRLRPHNPVVRVEVERAAPAIVRDVVLEDLRAEARTELRRAPSAEPGARPVRTDADAGELGAADIEEADGLLDLRGLDDLAPPDDDNDRLDYPRFRGARPVPAGQPFVDAAREQDLLVHHPFDSFTATVGRFLAEAADDPDVVAIKITLYRVGDRSPIVEALVEAARRGKSVVAFVELRARFDEERNVGWARALEQAGGRVVHGLVGLKNHAKVALVVRREAGKLRRYVHVGTGNYNARTARQYTDLSLFSADEALADDVTDLFNALTGSSRPPQRLARGALVAPHQLLPAILEHIEREAAHARAGREARITLKLNGLSDPDVVRALYRASQDGVRVDLVVRGICTLRPGIPGQSERIRVVSVVGRFLEHSRIYRFANDGQPHHYIGSADLRPRNLRRRVELLVPVRDAACRATLDGLLDRYLADPSAWELAPSGEYARRAGQGPATQDALVQARARPRDRAAT